MKISCRTPIVSLKKEQITHPDGEHATFRSCASEALIGYVKPGQEPQGRYALFCLAKKIQDEDVVDLSVEELSTVKQAVAAYPAFNNIVLGRIFDIIEGKVPCLEAVKEA